MKKSFEKSTFKKWKIKIKSSTKSDTSIVLLITIIFFWIIIGIMIKNIIEKKKQLINMITINVYIKKRIKKKEYE